METPSSRRPTSPSLSDCSSSRSSVRINPHRRKQTRAQDQLQRRVRALVSPSLHSVVSSATTKTSSSSGSNSTITQGSFSERRPSMNHDPTGRSRKRERRHRLSKVPSSESVNVFKYLDQGSPEQQLDDGWQSSHSSSGENESHEPPRLPPGATPSRSSSASPVSHRKLVRPVVWQTQDPLHSDSGISMRSSSIGSTDRSTTSHNHVTGKRSSKMSLHQRDPGACATIDDSRPPMSIEQKPEAHEPLAIPPYPNTALMSYGPMYPEMRPYYLDPGDDSMRNRMATSNAHNRLASRLSQRGPTPDQSPPQLYRKFHELNHRIALHLQGEISELEKTLKEVDQRIEANPSEWRSLEFDRTDILGRIFAKINQYSE